MIRSAVALALLLVASACSGDDTEPTAPSTTSTTATGETTTTADPNDVYADDASWLCRPDLEDACEDEIDATVIEADGSTSPDPFVAATDAPIDCFYVYPTVSNDPEDNSDMVVGSEERTVARQQAARLGESCAVYAPMYRQATLTALRRSLGGGGGGFFAAYGAAYADVLAAWRHYLAADNEGRGVILVGHSQGASHLLKLLTEEIDPDPAQRAVLVSAMLAGTSAHESELPHVPPCRSDSQTGCVISWSTFRDTAPPPSGSFFARPQGDEPAICTNPAALSGGSVPVHPYFLWSSLVGVEVSTPFMTLPDLVSAECRDTNGFNHLALTVHPDPGPRADDLRGDLTPEWGLHLIDVNVVMGDLVEVARSQAAAHSSG